MITAPKRTVSATLKPKVTANKPVVSITQKLSRPKSISITRGLSSRRSKPVADSPIQVSEPDILTYGEDTFSCDDVSKALREVSYSSEINAGLKSALSTYAPEISSNMITLPIENSYQLDGINHLKVYVIKLLRQKLNNKSIEFSTRLIKDKESKKLCYTDKDKLELMKDSNPFVDKFITTFGLVLK